MLEIGTGSGYQAAVLARHGLSGYGLNFEPRTERTRLEELFARGASRIRRPYESFFRALHAASGGLVRDALRLWLASIDGGGAMRLTSSPEADQDPQWSPDGAWIYFVSTRSGPAHVWGHAPHAGAGGRGHTHAPERHTAN